VQFSQIKLGKPNKLKDKPLNYVSYKFGFSLEKIIAIKKICESIIFYSEIFIEEFN